MSRTSASAPDLCAVVNMMADLSSPEGFDFSLPMTRNRVVLLGLSSILVNSICML